MPPPDKKAKISSQPSVPSASETAEYERHIEFLQQSFESKKWSLASMLTLLDETACLRRALIRDENLSVLQILEKFPCLADPKIVSKS